MSSLSVPSPLTSSRRAISLRIVPVLASLAVVLLVFKIWVRGIGSLTFDDSYMFVRYARHLRQGFGIAWNPAGPHTFGLTSLPWLAVVTLGSFFLEDPARLLVTLSTATGALALAALGWSGSRHARSSLLRRFSIVFPLLALPLVCSEQFNVSLGSGMETMLALLLAVLFADQILALIGDAPGRLSIPHLVGLAALGTLAVLTRPESILVVSLAPILAVALFFPGQKARLLLAFFVPLVALLGADLLFNRWYFGSPLPLAFYVKSLHGYRGYRIYMNPFAFTAFFLSMASAPLLLSVAFAQRKHWRLLAVFYLPALAIVLYLFGVLQIMGWGARYYVPYLPFLLLPGLLILDDRLLSAKPLALSPRRLVLVAAVLLCTSLQFTERFYIPLARMVAARNIFYAPPVFTTPNPLALPPQIFFSVNTTFTAFVASLPPGTLVAATEVGWLGVGAPRASILDIAGLNDAQLGRHGFSADYLFGQQPDVIWLPHPDYTYLNGTFSSDPRLLRDYDVYPSAFTWGIAINRHSPWHGQIEQNFQSTFRRLYPGLDPEPFLARSVHWDRNPVGVVKGIYE